ncbi:MAG: ATP-binding protein [Terriglobales bacterium]
MSHAAASSYRLGARLAAASVGIGAVLALAGVGGATLLAPLALLAAAAAVLLLESGRWLAGYAAALATLALGVAAWTRVWPVLGSLSTVWAVCLVVLGASLLVKRFALRVAVAADLFIAALAFVVVLEYAFAMGPHLGFWPALGLLVLASAWMSAFPEQRPVAYFLEGGSAGVVLRRVLPVTLLFPVLLVSLSEVQRHVKGLGQAAMWILLLCVVAFCVALLWLISSSLDRLDATRERAQHEREQAELQVRVLLESTMEGLFAVDMQGRCIWCNPAAVRLLGYQWPEELLGHNIHDLIHYKRSDGTPFPADECGMTLATRAGQPYTADEELVFRADGSSFPADCRSSPLIQNGVTTGAVVTFSDVSERKQLQAQFHQAQKMEAVGRLAAGVAHDFNNMLTVINGYADLILQRLGDDHGGAHEMQSRAESIRKAGERAAVLTRQLLAFSRKQVMQVREVNLNAVIADVETLLHRAVGEQVELELSLGQELELVRADPGQIGQVLMNLTVNARDAMPEGGRLTIATGNVEINRWLSGGPAPGERPPEVEPGNYVVLTVTDTGAGMDQRTQAHIFEPFFTTKSAGKGTGLGLATVFGIVKQSGGAITCRSVPGEGTAMTIYLPSAAHRPAQRQGASAELAMGA